MKIRSLFAVAVSLGILLPFSSADKTVGTLTEKARTVVVPPNNGSWYMCSTSKTQYVSYSIKLTTAASKPEAYGTTSPGKPSDRKYDGTGFTAWLIDQATLSSLTELKGAQPDYLPHESCINTLNKICESDLDGAIITPPTPICIVAVNPTKNELKVQAVVSFTTNVFTGKPPQLSGGVSAHDTVPDDPVCAGRCAGLPSWLWPLVASAALMILITACCLIFPRIRPKFVRNSSGPVKISKPFPQSSIDSDLTLSSGFAPTKKSSKDIKFEDKV